MIPLQLAGSLPFLAVALFVAGLAIAPTMALGERHVPRAPGSEGMTWSSTGLAVGVALGSSAAGRVVDASGAGTGYVVARGFFAGALAAAVALPGYRRLSEPVPTGGHRDHDRHLRTDGEHVA